MAVNKWKADGGEAAYRDRHPTIRPHACKVHMHIEGMAGAVVVAEVALVAVVAEL